MKYFIANTGRSFLFSSLLFMFVATLSAGAQTQEWNQWRGPGRDGAVRTFTPPARWPERLSMKWKVPVGGGFSSPVVSSSRVYVHSRRDEQEVVECLDLSTGKPKWSKSYPVAFTKNQYAVEMGKGPNSTPLLSAGKLYTLGVNAILSCFDANSGDLKWRKDFSSGLDTSKMFCGTAMSPLIDGGLVIVHVGDDRQGWVKAFEADTGKERWTWQGDGPGYASPIVVTLEGTRQLVTLTDKSVIGVAVDSGKLLWKLPFPDEWNENIVTPVLYQKMLILSGVRKGTMAIQLVRDGEKWTTKQVWHNPKIAMYMNSPVLEGDLLFGLSHLRKGQFFCLNAQTGETLWATEGRDGQNAALLNVAGALIILTADGDLIVARKSAKGFEQIARYDVADSATWSHPIAFGRQILIKDSSTLALWSLE